MSRINPSRSRQRAHDVVAILCLCIVGLIAAGYLFPLFIRATYKFQIMYNEGWNVYHTEEVAQGRQLYAQPRQYTAVNYPPLAFYVVAAATKFVGDPLFAGRLVSAISLLASAVLLAGVVFAMVRSWTSAALGGLLMLVLLARYASDYIASDDPQLLATAILMLGVLLFVSTSSPAGTVTSAAIAGTALFVKHSIIVFPIAITLVLLVSTRKRLTVWMAALAAAVLGWIGFCYLVHGPYFFSSLLTPHAFRNMRAPMSFMILLDAIQLPFVVAIVWLLVDRTARYRTLLAAAIGLAIVYGLYVSRSDGAWVNHWFEVIIAVSMAASMAWARAETFWTGAGWPRRWVLALFPVLLTLGAAAQGELPRRIMGLDSQRQEWALAESRFAEDVAYERMHAGPAICEDLSLCAVAGKPLEYDPFGARQRILRDAAAAAPIVRDLQAHRYQTVQVNVSPDIVITGADRALFPEQFMRTLLANYHIDRRTCERAFFVPGR
jgi:Dolichyl-phosphate-mannose-protein mannosyltransferase